MGWKSNKVHKKSKFNVTPPTIPTITDNVSKAISTQVLKLLKMQVVKNKRMPNRMTHILVYIVLLESTRIFSFTLIDDIFFDYFDIVLSSILVFGVILKDKLRPRTKRYFSKFIYCIIFITLISSISAYFFHNQSFALSLLASRTVFFWLFYFILHKIDVNEEVLINILRRLGIFWSCIMILQQFTYPTLFFNELLVQTNNEIQIDIDRGGLLRIFVAGEIFGTLLVFYSWRKIQQRIKFKFILSLLIGILGLFLTGSRQVIFSTLLVIFGDSFFSTRFKNLFSTKYIIALFAVSASLYLFAFDYLSTLIQLSLKQKVSSKDYIRSLEINYFLFEYWPSWLAIILGNGWEHASSSYGKNILIIKETLRFYRSDIGIIGALSKFGIFYCLLTLSLYYKIIIPNSRFKVPGYIRLVFIYCLATSLSTGNYFERNSVYICLICLFYLIDKNNAKSFNSNTNLQSLKHDSERVRVSV